MQRKRCFTALRYSVSLLVFLHSRDTVGVFWHQVSRQQWIFFCPILILLWTCFFVLTFISENVFLSTVHVEPNRLSVPSGATAARFLSGSEMKRQRETISVSGLFWARTRMCIEQLRDVIWQNGGSFSMCLLAPNPVSPLLWLALCKGRVSRRETCAFPARQDNVTSLNHRNNPGTLAHQ